jgi:hypothetical protein
MSFTLNSIGDFVIGAPVGDVSHTAAVSNQVSEPSAAGEEFHAMVESSEGVQQGGLGIFKSIGDAQMRAEGALLDVVKTGNPMRMYDATASMAKVNTEVLVFAKMAAKASQAVDRLTNLQ